MSSKPDSPNPYDPVSKVESLNTDCPRHLSRACATRMSDEEAQQISDQLKALSHPVRLQILHYLGESESCCCNDVCACIPLAQSTISQHLKILNNAGVIDARPVGNRSIYTVNQRALAEIIETLNSLQELTNGQLAFDAEGSRKENPDGKN